MAALVYWLVRQRAGRPDPRCFVRPASASQIFLQQVALGTADRAPDLSQLVWGYNASRRVTLAPLSLTMFGVALLAGKRTGRRRASSVIRAGFVLLAASTVILIPLVPRADSGWHLVIPLMLAGAGLGLLAPQLNNYALLIEERSARPQASPPQRDLRLLDSRSRARSCSPTARSLSRTWQRQQRPAPGRSTESRRGAGRGRPGDEHSWRSSAGQPETIQDEILSINTDARHLALQVALLVALLAALVGFVNAFRMMRLPDPAPSVPAEGRGAWLIPMAWPALTTSG